MINKIIDGISVALNTEFGDTYEIYTESVEQGLEEPCFSIVCLNPTMNQFLGNRYFRTNQFCIHYFPTSEDKNMQCNEVRERMFNCLEIIDVDGDPVRGTKIETDFTDGVLNFFINYDMFVKKVEDEKVTMESVELDTDVKG